MALQMQKLSQNLVKTYQILQHEHKVWHQLKPPKAHITTANVNKYLGLYLSAKYLRLTAKEYMPKNKPAAYNQFVQR